MHILSYSDPSDFLNRVEPVLLENEMLNNLPLGIVYRLVESFKYTVKDVHHDGPLPFMAVVSNDEKDILILVKTTEHLILYISEQVVNDEFIAEACSTAIQYIVEQEISVPSIIALRETAFLFAKEWNVITGQSSEIQMDQRIYVCTQVKDLKLSPGIFRAAEFRDIPLLGQWIYEFAAEALEVMSIDRAIKLAKTATESSAIYLWIDDGEPVSMAQQTRPTLHGAVVNMVYTPPEHRNQGYASSCVSTLTRNMLRGSYQFTSLYTDLSNPVSNHIYMNIGYEPKADSVVVVFK
ncbi:putative GNAT family acetyltransferase [Paenibacillus sp. DS2015]|uniref:GNAT family N-acetyltransferase n=1 Tax=Paenibacillus sp. DS2015 TaxID=3373917 RepID=UPI003D22B96B